MDRGRAVYQIDKMLSEMDETQRSAIVAFVKSAKGDDVIKSATKITKIISQLGTSDQAAVIEFIQAPRQTAIPGSDAATK